MVLTYICYCQKNMVRALHGHQDTLSIYRLWSCVSRCCSRRETVSRSSASSTSVEVLSLCAPRDSIFCDLLQNYNPEFELNILSIFLGIKVKQKWATIFLPAASRPPLMCCGRVASGRSAGVYVLLVCRLSPHHDNIIFEDLRAQATKVGFCWTFLSLDSFDLRLKEV